MTLEELATGALPVPLSLIGADTALARQVQGRLAHIGLLDPPVDGQFGAVSQWALDAFLRRIGTPAKASLDVEAARALLAPGAADLYPVHATATLAGRVVAALQAAGHWINRHPQALNIVYVEGLDADGTANDDAPNVFNDLRLLLRINKAGNPEIVASWEATSEPGRFFTLNKLDPRGAARIAFGQYKAWVMGTHNLGKPTAHEALVQAQPIRVHRDLNADFERDDDAVFTGIFGINQHWGFDLPKKDIGKASAGCLVGRTKAGHREFIALLKQDPRYVASHGYRFMTAVLSATQLPAA